MRKKEVEKEGKEVNKEGKAVEKEGKKEVDVVAHWKRTRLLLQRSRVRIRHLPQRSVRPIAEPYAPVDIRRL